MQQHHAHISQALERAWQHQDLAALGSVLAENLQWHEGPFAAPLTTRAQVLTQWQNDLATQSDINVSITLLDFVDDRSYHHCVASWSDSKTGSHKLDGIFKAQLDPEGRVIAYTMWSAAH